MKVRRMTGAGVLALIAFCPTPAAPQDLAPFVPPPCVPGQEMFSDVSASNPFCPWIEQLARDHVTGGCAPLLFCPTAPLTRQQMSVFLELAMRGTDTWIVNADLLDGMNSSEFVTSVGAGIGLTGGGSGGNLTLALAPPYQLPQTCNGGQHPEWTGSAWGCGVPGTGTVTSVGTGAGLTGGPITTSGTISVATGGITSAMIADGAVGSADVADGSIGADDVAVSQVQIRVAQACSVDQFMRAVNVDGSVWCDYAANHNHFGQIWGGNGSGSSGLSVDNSNGDGITASSPTIGVHGITTSGAGRAVVGEATGISGETYGVHGVSEALSGRGVVGQATASEGLAYGVVGLTASTDGRAVAGEATATSGGTYGVYGVSASPFGKGVYGMASASSGPAYGILGETASPDGFGVVGVALSASGASIAVLGITNSPSGYAARLFGDVSVGGTLEVSGDLFVSGTKSFRIDHPLDPANRYLVHAAIESSEMLNMYSGTVVLDASGTATVQLPDWFETLNRDFRYQLTCIGGYAPVFIASEIRGGRFGIAGGREGLKVSWQVVGTRSDAHAVAHPMVVEQEKPAEERGTYLDPEAHGQPAELGRDYRLTSALRKQ